MSTHDFDPIFRPHAALRRHAPRLLVLSAAALLLHAAVLGGATWGWPSNEALRSPAPATMQVRLVEPAEHIAVVPPTPRVIDASVAKAAVPAPRSTEPPPRRAAAPKPVPSATPDAAVPMPVIDQPTAMPAVQLALATASRAATSASTTPAATLDDEETIPHYRTRMPPAATLRYDVSRGMLHGTGDLVWRPQGDRYDLKLDFKLGGMTILSQASSGAFDASGIAPVRFTDQRFKRGTTAANFQREADKITYSGSSSEFPLRAGTQDRLSWMMQLAAIVSAEPQLAKPGAKVAMHVTGANGDVGVWVFRCLGPDAVDQRGASLDAIKFVREPREPHDTAVQVWLDPKRHDLPVRATQKSGAGDEGYELRLLEVRAGN